MPLAITLNGAPRVVDALDAPAALSQVIASLGLKADRVAVELNGEIVPRSGWDQKQVTAGDRLEVVHFVGGGLDGGATRAPALIPQER